MVGGVAEEVGGEEAIDVGLVELGDVGLDNEILAGFEDGFELVDGFVEDAFGLFVGLFAGGEESVGVECREIVGTERLANVFVNVFFELGDGAEGDAGGADTLHVFEVGVDPGELAAEFVLEKSGDAGGVGSFSVGLGGEEGEVDGERRR